MFWDPERFPIMSYEVWKELGNMARFIPRFIPWHWRMFFRFYMPKSFSKVKHMKNWRSFFSHLNRSMSASSNIVTMILALMNTT